MKDQDKTVLGSVIEIAANILFGGFDPKLILGFGLLVSFTMLLSLLVSSTNTPTLFDSGPAKIEEVCEALEGGFVSTKKDAGNYIAGYINSTYSCKGGVDSLSYLQNGTYVFSSDACEIAVVFEPELEEFAQHIDAHANAVNSTLQFFQEGGSALLTGEEKEVSDQLTDIDEDGNLSLNGYGQDLLSSYDSEYADSQSEAYFNTLQSYSYSIFDYEKDTSEWTYSNFHIGKKAREKTVCYRRIRQPDMTYRYETVACELPHDREETEIEYIDVLFGRISVPMKYDATKYKENEISKTVSDLSNQELYLSTGIDDAYEKRKIGNSDEAKRLIENVISDYELSYLLGYLGGSYGYGYSGLVTSGGFNYLETTDDKTATALFWAYSDGLNTVLHTLAYKTDSSAGGPVMSHQCTQFAATFFYDVYGFAALRGNGNMQADYLLKDCGKDSACPVKFERSATPAPGAIVSLYPNHVIVIDEVDDGGKIYISEGNYNGKGAVRTHQVYNSLFDYIAKTGYAVKSIAIPIR